MLAQASRHAGFEPDHVVGIGVDTTGSTPLPVDARGWPLALDPKFSDEPAALAWLWKDHTGHAEAEEITAVASRLKPEYLAKCGGRYSSEWFWSKILHCARKAPKVFDAAYTWVEIADWIPAALAGKTAPEHIKRGICAAGHKAFYSPEWGGYPDAGFLSTLDPRLVRVRQSLPEKVYSVEEVAGGLSAEFAAKSGLKANTPIAVGLSGHHLGAVGSGIGPGVLVKLIGTSTCDIMVSPEAKSLPDIPGLCGIVPGSVVPSFFGLEAGQSAVGDIFNWFVSVVQPGGAEKGGHGIAWRHAALKPGESGLLSLDWHNGNRTVLVDQRLTGLIVGLTLHSTPAQIYRALIEATAFGSRIIMERFEEFGIKVERVVNGGGIAAKNPLAMQIYADIMNRPVAISRSAQTCALGSAIAGAVAARKAGGGHDTFDDAIRSMAGAPERVFSPIPENARVYAKLFELYRKLHDAFGLRDSSVQLGNVMKELLDIRDQAQGTLKE